MTCLCAPLITVMIKSSGIGKVSLIWRVFMYVMGSEVVNSGWQRPGDGKCSKTQ